MALRILPASCACTTPGPNRIVIEASIAAPTSRPAATPFTHNLIAFSFPMELQERCIYRNPCCPRSARDLPGEAGLLLCTTAEFDSKIIRTDGRSRNIDLKRDDFSSSRHPALAYCWSMIFSENRYPPRIESGAGFFWIMPCAGFFRL